MGISIHCHDIGQQLRARRRALGLGQKHVAFPAGIDQTMISRYERGHKEPSIEQLSKMADVLGLTLRIELVPKDEGPAA